jgi:hypothetical protein
VAFFCDPFDRVVDWGVGAVDGDGDIDSVDVASGVESDSDIVFRELVEVFVETKFEVESEGDVEELVGFIFEVGVVALPESAINGVIDEITNENKINKITMRW